MWRRRVQVQGVPSMGKEGEKSGVPQKGKSAPRREEAGASHWGKGAGRREEAEEGGERKGGAPQKGKSTARIEEELNGRAKKKGRETLWRRHPRRGTIF